VTLVYRLVDALREALVEGLTPLLRRFADAHTRIHELWEADRITDSTEQTRAILKGGIDALTPATKWEKPKRRVPQQEEGTNVGSEPSS
jgi:hypothetical protein